MPRNSGRSTASTSATAARFHVFKGIEFDILGDGSLDYPDDVLASFDLVIASIHSKFRHEPQGADGQDRQGRREPVHDDPGPCHGTAAAEAAGLRGRHGAHPARLRPARRRHRDQRASLAPGHGLAVVRARAGAGLPVQHRSRCPLDRRDRQYPVGRADGAKRRGAEGTGAQRARTGRIWRPFRQPQEQAKPVPAPREMQLSPQRRASAGYFSGTRVVRPPSIRRPHDPGVAASCSSQRPQGACATPGKISLSPTRCWREAPVRCCACRCRRHPRAVPCRKSMSEVAAWPGIASKPQRMADRHVVGAAYDGGCHGIARRADRNAQWAPRLRRRGRWHVTDHHGPAGPAGLQGGQGLWRRKPAHRRPVRPAVQPPRPAGGLDDLLRGGLGGAVLARVWAALARS